MAAQNYDEALRRVLVHEGGYTNHPSDPGGPTSFGITLADYRRYVKPYATAVDVRAMSVGAAKAIYRKRYWDAQRCDELPAGLDYSVFDYGVNSGIGRSGRVLRRLVGLPDNTELITDQVLAAISKRDAKSLINAINDERLRFLRGLRTWGVFGAGWSRRVAEVRAASLHMAQHAGVQVTNASSPRVSSPTDLPSAKGMVPPPTSAHTVIGTAGVGGAAAVSAVLHTVGVHPLEIAAVIIGIAALAGIGFAIVHRSHQAMKDAPHRGTVAVPEKAAACVAALSSKPRHSKPEPLAACARPQRIPP
jgi:lysozyme family protein